MGVYEFIEEYFITIINFAILAVEVIGVVILLVTSVQALCAVFKSTVHSRKLLGEGISTALSFLLTSEVMKTIVAPDWKDIGMTCATLLMRAAMTVLIHWEEKNEHHAHVEAKEHEQHAA